MVTAMETVIDTKGCIDLFEGTVHVGSVKPEPTR